MNKNKCMDTSSDKKGNCTRDQLHMTKTEKREAAK